MKQSFLSRLHIVRTIIVGGVFVAMAGALTPVRADDDHGWRDQRWHEHQQREHDWQPREHHHGRWDHRYWDDDGGGYVYRPPAVYYAPPPPSGVDFVFRLGR